MGRQAGSIKIRLAFYVKVETARIAGCDFSYVRGIGSIFLMAMLATAAALPARAGVVRSPDVAHTFAVGSMIDHELRWLRGSHALVATVTFSNVDYVERTEARRDEVYNFFLPGIRYDEATGIFYDPAGVPVAALHRLIIGARIELLPGARIWVENESGTVHLSLEATEEAQPGLRWVEKSAVEFLPGIFG